MDRVQRAWRSLRRARQIAMIALALLVLGQSIWLVVAGVSFLLPIGAILFLIGAILIKQSALTKDMAAQLSSGNSVMSRTHRSMQLRLTEMERLQRDSSRAVGLLREHVGRTAAQFDWVAEHVLGAEAEIALLARWADTVTTSVNEQSARLSALDSDIDALERDLEQAIAAVGHAAVEASSSLGRHVTSSLDRHITSIGRQIADENRALDEQLGARLAAVNKRLIDAFDGGNSHSLERKIVSEVSALMLLRGMADRPALPAFGGWSMAPLAVHFIQTVIDDLGPQHSIVELGSGVSTAWTAFALSGRDDAPRFISVDHDPAFAAETAKQLARLGVSDGVELIVAALEPVMVDNVSRRWYATGWTAEVSSIGLLIVDGPPAGKDVDARFPAIPLLVNKLADRAIVLVDDADRPGEADMIAAWLKIPGFSSAGFVGRSMILRYVRDEGVVS